MIATASYMLGVGTGFVITIAALFVYALGWAAGKRVPTPDDTSMTWRYDTSTTTVPAADEAEGA